MPVVAVIDYDMGNLHSACKGLEMAGANPIVTNNPQELADADAIVLPGVGSFDPAMQKLRANKLEQPIHDAIASGKPFLGICLGTSPWMYFVHSYYTSPIDSSVTAATTTHGSQTVTVAIAKDNVMAVQFHPEKSSNDGIHLLSNFVRMISA